MQGLLIKTAEEVVQYHLVVDDDDADDDEHQVVSTKGAASETSVIPRADSRNAEPDASAIKTKLKQISASVKEAMAAEKQSLGALRITKEHLVELEHEPDELKKAVLHMHYAAMSHDGATFAAALNKNYSRLSMATLAKRLMSKKFLNCSQNKLCEAGKAKAAAMQKTYDEEDKELTQSDLTYMTALQNLPSSGQISHLLKYEILIAKWPHLLYLNTEVRGGAINFHNLATAKSVNLLTVGDTFQHGFPDEYLEFQKLTKAIPTTSVAHSVVGHTVLSVAQYSASSDGPLAVEYPHSRAPDFGSVDG